MNKSGNNALKAHERLMIKHNLIYKNGGSKKYAVLSNYHSRCRVDVLDLGRKLTQKEKRENYGKALNFIGAKVIRRNYN